MNWREWFTGMKWHLALFWTVCLLALLWGGQRLYRTSFVIRPALAQAAKLQGVQDVEFKENDLYVKLQAHSNLKTTSEELSQIAAQFLGQESSLFIIDKRNQALEQIAEELSLSLAQAASRGEFESMRPHWQSISEKAGAQIDVAVDANAMYISLKQGEHYLYEILPREDRRQLGEKALLETQPLPKILAKEGQL